MGQSRNPTDLDAANARRAVGARAKGGWIIAGMFGLALVAALGTHVYYRSLQQRPLALWGTPTALTILRADRVDAIEWGPIADQPQTPTAGESDLSAPRDAVPAFDKLGSRAAGRRVLRTRDVTKARGLSHIRQGLVHDRAYIWDAMADAAAPNWRYAVRFSPAAPDPPVMLLFDPDSGAIASAGEGPRAVLVPEVAKALAGFLEVELHRESTADD